MVPLRPLGDLGACVSFFWVVEVVHVRLKLADVAVKDFDHGVSDLSGFVDLGDEGCHLMGLYFDAAS